MFNCFNCDVSTNFYGFLKHIDMEVYKEYCINLHGERKPKVVKQPNFKQSVTVTSLKSNIPQDAIVISKLPSNHPAVVELNRRKIPKEYWNRLLYVKKFKTWVCWG